MSPETPFYVTAVQNRAYSSVHALAPTGGSLTITAWCGVRLTPYYRNLGMTKTSNIECARCQRSIARFQALPSTPQQGNPEP